MRLAKLGPLSLLLLLWAELIYAGPRILIVGDSLTEGYGVAATAAYPAQLEALIRQGGLKGVAVVNAGTSGATSAFCLKTLTFQLKHQKPDLMLLALGANDALRGVAPEETEKNLSACLRFAAEQKVKTYLVGMLAPPNYGIKFPEAFKAIFSRLAEKYRVPLIPFLLEGVAGEPLFNLADGIHPNENGYKIVAKHVYDSIKGDLK